jgi:hypothetical protein
MPPLLVGSILLAGGLLLRRRTRQPSDAAAR